MADNGEVIAAYSPLAPLPPPPPPPPNSSRRSSREKSHASADSVARYSASGNRNVRLAIAFTFLAGTARGVWSFAVLSGYLYVLTGDNSSVGLAEGAQGIAQLLVALLAGLLLDRWFVRSRERVLRLGAAVGCAGAALILLAVALPSRLEGGKEEARFLLLTAGLAVFGAYQGVWNTALETIFADSIPTGHRQKALTQKFGATLIASCSGPLLANFYFYAFRADEWSLPALRDVLAGGVALCVPPMLLLCFFRDEDCLGASADAVDTSAAADHDAGGGGGGGGRGEGRERGPWEGIAPGEEAEEEEEEEGSEGEHNEEDDDEEADARNGDGCQGGHAKAGGEASMVTTGAGGGGRGSAAAAAAAAADGVRSYVLRVTVLNDLVSGLGSGMSVKFMPLFFKNGLELDPTEVNWIMVAAPMWMAAGSWCARSQAKRYGRARVAMCFGLTGAAAMVALGSLPKHSDGCDDDDYDDDYDDYGGGGGGGGDGDDGSDGGDDGSDHHHHHHHHHHPWARDWRVCVPLYFLSCAQHCCRPLKKSILMDFSERRHRGGWNAVDSITRFGWSGSAVVGGFLIDSYSYQLNFVVTGAMLGIAALLWPLIFIYVDKADRLSASSPQLLASSLFASSAAAAAVMKGGNSNDGSTPARAPLLESNIGRR